MLGVKGDFSDDSDTIRTHLKDCKEIVDDYYKNPQNYED